MAKSMTATNSMLDGIVYREAGPDDIRALICMADDIYNGGDYLDFAYHAYMTSPNVRCFLATSQGRMVGFVCMYVVDGGERVVVGAGRTDNALERHGIQGKLQNFGLRQVLADKMITPNCLVLYAAFQSDVHRERFSKRADQYQLLSQRCIADFVQPLGDLQKLARSRHRDSNRKSPKARTMRYPSLEEFSDVFLCKQAIRKLFPDEIIITFWDPFRADLINAKEVYNACIVQMSGEGRGRLCDAISFLFHIPCRMGARFDVEFYGTSYEQLEEHVLAGIEWISQGFSFTNSEVPVHLCVYYPSPMASAVKGSLASTLGLELGPWSRSNTGATTYIIACKGPVLPQESPIPGTLQALKSRL